MLRRTFIKITAGAVGAAAAGLAKGEEEAAPLPGDVGKLANELRQEKDLVVGVFNDSAFRRPAVPSTLKWEHFRDAWGAPGKARVVPLDRNQIRSYTVIFDGKMDILVYPYGPAYLMDTPPFFNGDTILGLLKRGGAILTTGGVPFGDLVLNDSNSMDGGGSPTPNDKVFRRWVAPLGYKFYQHRVTPPVLKADRDFLPSFPENAPLAGSPIGIVANNSSHDPVPCPYHGNVFPERYPARQVTPLLFGTDHYGQTLATNALLIQDFENGSRRIHFSHLDDAHPLNPQSPWFPALMTDVWALLTNRLFVKDVSTGYACYRAGEEVEVRAEFISFEKVATDAEVQVQIRNRETNAVVDDHHETVHFPAGKSVLMEWKWKPARFDTDDYAVSVSIVRGGRTVARGRNGFLVWNDDVVRRGPSVAIKDGYFRRSDGETFALGTNYYESTRGEIMWFRPDVERLSLDLRSMRACGVSYIRPHYHHLKWFRDYLMFQHQRLLPYFERLEKVSDPFPDEAAWRIFDVFIYLCQKLGIAYGGDLFTLVPKELGDPRGWCSLSDAVLSEDARAHAKEFFRRINDRYKEAPCILWDLWNEPDVKPELLAGWAREMKNSIAHLPSPRLITVGGGTGQNLGSAIDFIGLHIGAADIKHWRLASGPPQIAQETYMDRPENLSSELEQASVMRDGILSSVKVGLTGFAPWSWTRQMRLWQDSYQHDPEFRMESWDDRLGCQVHDDGTLKPAGLVFKDMSALLKTIDFSSYDAGAGKSKTTRGEVAVDVRSGGDAVLTHSNGDKLFGAAAIGAITWNNAKILSGPDGSSVYVFCTEDDVLSGKKVYFKADLPGTLRLARSTAPKSVALVDLQPGVEKQLDSLTASMDGNMVSITTTPTQEGYWIAASW